MIEHAPVDVCIAGGGPAGLLICRLLAEAGLRAVVLEAGPAYPNPRTEFVEDELAMRKLWWPEDYGLSGDALRTGLNAARGIGGTSLLWSGAVFRLFPDDFRALSIEGQPAGANLADWPLEYADLEPYYDLVEGHIGVAGAPGPHDPPGRKSYPQPPHGLHTHSALLRSGFEKVGLRWQPGPVAILSQPREGREACCSCGFCSCGCRTGAMYNAAVVELPAALATGRAEIRPEATAVRVHTSPDGTVAEAIEYTAGGEQQLQPASTIVIAANTIETPRLILNSASRQHPNGLANSGDQVGRNLTTHPSASAWGVFEQDMNPWEGFLINHICCLDYAPTRPEQGFVRGFVMESMTALPVNLATVIAANYWGADLKRVLRSYRRLAGLFTVCEGLPVASNRVTVDPSARDEFGMPRGRIHYDWHDNDRRMIELAARTSEDVLRAAGAVEVFRQPPSQLHMMGTARMGNDPSTSVTDSFGRTHDVSNLYLAGGALFPSGSAVNPTLTILALAWRAAEEIIRTKQAV